MKKSIFKKLKRCPSLSSTSSREQDQHHEQHSSPPILSASLTTQQHQILTAKGFDQLSFVTKESFLHIYISVTTPTVPTYMYIKVTGKLKHKIHAHFSSVGKAIILETALNVPIWNISLTYYCVLMIEKHTLRMISLPLFYLDMVRKSPYCLQRLDTACYILHSDCEGLGLSAFV